MDIEDEVNPDVDHVPGHNRGEKRGPVEAEPEQEPQPDQRCSLPKCKSFGKIFSSVRNYNKHIKY